MFEFECIYLVFKYLHYRNYEDFLEENHGTQNYISNSTDKNLLIFSIFCLKFEMGGPFQKEKLKAHLKLHFTVLVNEM